MPTTAYQIDVIKAFNDNYIWLLRNQQYAVIVDPSDANVCINYLKQHGLILTDILITHHHHDHIGGLSTLIEYNEQRDQATRVYAPKLNEISGTTHPLVGNETIVLEQFNTTFKVIALPGHTLGHIGYVDDASLFCGDTLFSAGCGRLFEGTPAQMSQSLAQLAQLKDTTKVYCSHEYTLANLTFALMVEPNNLDILNYYNQVVEARKQDKTTLPSTIGLEKTINPFLRCHLPQIQQAASDYKNAIITTSIETFAAIRQWKDNV
ncbi:hydroxyacylglutathione hydrolase [Thalassotalea sp. LPB0316]|uniref:hydroxyacylglutathione hydrolase n=1 Tax=Thalassotalea sp. LPB0316 TaxID=2769490 RepID=UPI0018689DE3|nr:hydroxyacylglutathione hydrolase [Thalassotalea sp. LPB0316]QOL24576.1 hydroxyacylglutathione hydrolase [Thalassotalea sp. LPB0316]